MQVVVVDECVCVFDILELYSLRSLLSSLHINEYAVHNIERGYCADLFANLSNLRGVCING